MTEKLARDEDLSDPLVVNTQYLAFRGQTVSYILHNVIVCVGIMYVYMIMPFIGEHI